MVGLDVFPYASIVEWKRLLPNEYRKTEGKKICSRATALMSPPSDIGGVTPVMQFLKCGSSYTEETE